MGLVPFIYIKRPISTNIIVATICQTVNNKKPKFYKNLTKL